MNSIYRTVSHSFLVLILALIPIQDVRAKSQKTFKDKVFGEKNIVGLPPCGKIGVGIGQTTIQLYNYKKEVLEAYKKAAYPYAINLYTEFKRGFFLAGMSANNVNADGSLREGFLPWRNNSPIATRCNPTAAEAYDFNEERNHANADDLMNFEATLGEYPKALLVIGFDVTGFADQAASNEPTRALDALYTGKTPVQAGLSQEILDQYRNAVQVFVCHVKNLDRNVLVRFGYECDFLFNGYDPELFKNAFRYLKQQLVINGANNVGMVCHFIGSWNEALAPVGTPYDQKAPGHYDLWYPGDEFVDWLGLSFWVTDQAYQVRGCYTAEANGIRDDIYAFARKHNKPVQYSEMSPAGLYIPQVNTYGHVFVGSIFGCTTPFATTTEEIWKKWYDAMFTEAENNRDVVRLISNYINANWAGSTCDRDGLFFGDSRLQTNDTILKRFFARIATKPYFQTCRPKLANACAYPFEIDCDTKDVICPETGAIVKATDPKFLKWVQGLNSAQAIKK